MFTRRMNRALKVLLTGGLVAAMSVLVPDLSLAGHLTAEKESCCCCASDCCDACGAADGGATPQDDCSCVVAFSGPVVFALTEVVHLMPPQFSGFVLQMTLGFSSRTDSPPTPPPIAV